MILYQNNLMQLHFDPANSLMVVNWPNFEAYSLADTQLALSRLVNTVKNYEVKKLLVDATNAKLNVDISTYNEIVKHFALLLHETTLEKIARIKTDDPDREKKAADTLKEVPEFIKIQNFTNAADAKAWLLKS